MGTAVVNDATAVYYNPAALALLKNPQIISLNSLTYFSNQFSGETIQLGTGFTQSGSSLIQTHYFLPSLYIATPITKKIKLGLAIISNDLNKDIDGNSVLRYVESSNRINSIDFVPAIEYQFNDSFSAGVGMSISHANFLLMPIAGFPSLNVPDSQSRNECSGDGIGGDIGCLLKLGKSTVIGFNYRSSVTYRLNGTSTLEGNSPVVSDQYGFTFWTPARSVLSINQTLTPSLGVIGTVQRIQWSIFKEINIHGIATQIGSQPVILNAVVPYHYRDTWLVTLGGHYSVTPKWKIRLATTYNQSPGNGDFQISKGDDIVLGTSMGYELSKNITVDGGFAHVFVLNKNIHVTGITNKIDGNTHGYLNAVSLKLTLNLN